MNENENIDPSEISPGVALAYIVGVQLVGSLVGLAAGIAVGKVANKVVLPRLANKTTHEI